MFVWMLTLSWDEKQWFAGRVGTGMDGGKGTKPVDGSCYRATEAVHGLC